MYLRRTFSKHRINAASALLDNVQSNFTSFISSVGDFLLFFIFINILYCQTIYILVSLLIVMYLMTVLLYSPDYIKV